MQVSLITCTNDSEKTIKNCCLSVSSQSYSNIEHIILDKNSKDNTISIVKKYGAENLKIYHQKSSGIYGALNEGMKAANGEIIGILHSDDQFENDQIISIIIKKFIENDLDILFSNLFYTKKNNTNKIIRRWSSNLEEGIQSNLYLDKKINNGWMPPHTTLFIKKNLLNEVEHYDESFKISSDYDFMIRLIKKMKFKIFFLNSFTVRMRVGGNSNKNIQNILIKMKEDYRIMKKFNLNPFKTILIKNLSKISQFF